METIRDRALAAFVATGKTYGELATLAGVDKGYLHRLINGTAPFDSASLEVLRKLAAAMGTTVGYLESGNGPSHPPDFTPPKIKNARQTFVRLAPDLNVPTEVVSHLQTRYASKAYDNPQKYPVEWWWDRARKRMRHDKAKRDHIAKAEHSLQSRKRAEEEEAKKAPRSGETGRKPAVDE